MQPDCYGSKNFFFILFRSSSENESEFSDYPWSDYPNSELRPPVYSSEDESEIPVVLSDDCFPGYRYITWRHEERLSEAGYRFIGPCSPIQKDAFYWCILVMESYLGYAMLNAPVDGINHVLSQLIKHQRFDLDLIEGHPYTDACYLLNNLSNVKWTYGSKIQYNNAIQQPSPYHHQYTFTCKH
jgi:hypothetical protein